jgi:hypothetical protein
VWLRTLKLTRLVSSKYALVRHTSLMIKMIIKHKKHTVYRVLQELLITRLQIPRKVQFKTMLRMVGLRPKNGRKH